MTPFSALYGQEVVSPITWHDPIGRVEVSKQMFETMEAQTKRVRDNLRIAQSWQKSYADKGRIHSEFQEGDQGWLRVKPRNSGLSLGACKKLSPRYCGPFRVLQRIGDLVYKL